MSADRLHRRKPAHFPAQESGNRSIIVFLTLCTRDRQPILANHDAHYLLCEAWTSASLWLVGRYVIMPDHIHLFCAPNSLVPHPLDLWISYWRNRVSRTWPHAKEKPLWQKDYWDRQLRSGDSYSQKWEYVRNNPVRHGLAAQTEDWLFQGEANVLRWHER